MQRLNLYCVTSLILHQDGRGRSCANACQLEICAVQINIAVAVVELDVIVSSQLR